MTRGGMEAIDSVASVKDGFRIQASGFRLATCAMLVYYIANLGYRGNLYDDCIKY